MTDQVADIFNRLSARISLSDADGLMVTSPCDGQEIARVTSDTAQSLDQKNNRAMLAQKRFALLPRTQKAAFLENLSAAIRRHQDSLALLITLEAGKTKPEALGEVIGAADVLLKTCKDTDFADFGGMHRNKERSPVGVVGLITSFNFPLVVANWTIAPALLAGNAVLWKPSEKTPLTALAYKAVFNQVAEEHADLLNVIVGGRKIGEQLVACEMVDMISATGSVAMGKGIKSLLAKKHNNAIKPILELGGNNGVIISQKLSTEHLEWAVKSVLNSFLGTTGQRCTNTRRLIVHQSIYDQIVALLEKHIHAFLGTNTSLNPLNGINNEYGYGPLIDHDAYQRFEQAKVAAIAEAGKVLLGNRLNEKKLPQAYYVEPALALLPEQTNIMFEETFAPLLYVTPYDSDFAQAMAILNAPENAGLVNGLYTQSKQEADQFAAENQAGHSVINSPKGTGTPAFGLGFGGNKASGEGEILNSADPLRPFTRDDIYHRTAWNADIPLHNN